MFIYCNAILKDVFMDYSVDVDEIDEKAMPPMQCVADCRSSRSHRSACLPIQCVSAARIFPWISYQCSNNYFRHIRLQLIVLINFVSYNSSLHLKAIMNNQFTRTDKYFSIGHVIIIYLHIYFYPTW